MDELSGAHADTISKTLDTLPENKSRLLDPGNPGDLQTIKSLLKISGKTPETHPGLFGDLTASHPQIARAQADNHRLDIVDSGKDSKGRATARVWYSSKGNPLLSSSTVMTLHPDTGQLLSSGTTDKIGNGVVMASTDTATAQPAPNTLTTLGFFHTQTDAETAPVFGAIKQTIATTKSVARADIQAPVSTKNPNIFIGLGRGPNGITIKGVRLTNADCDYTYTQDNQDLSTPPLMVPFVGSMNMHAHLDKVGPDGHFTSDLSLSTHIVASQNNSTAGSSMSQAALAAGVTGDVATNTVHWSFPYDPNHTSPADSKSLIYEGHAKSNTFLNDFFFRFLVPIKDLPVRATFTVCSCQSPNEPSDNCTIVKKLVFFWHCLAADTRVSLADGSIVALHACDNTMRVQTGATTPDLGIEATTRGVHLTQDHSHPHDGIRRLVTKAGRELIGTAQHPIGVPSGFVIMSDLKPGDEILTIDGDDRVATCEPIEYDGIFANLKLINQNDREKGVPDSTVGSFVANGIVVGDVYALEATMHNNLHSLEYMMPRISERYHQDFESSLAAIHAAKATS